MESELGDMDIDTNDQDLIKIDDALKEYKIKMKGRSDGHAKYVTQVLKVVGEIEKSKKRYLILLT